MAGAKIAEFDNTEIAFRGKSDQDLKRAYWLFRIIDNSILAKIGLKLTGLAIRIGLPVMPLVKSTIFKHFCGGETIEECEPVISQLASAGVGSILDYSVEGEQKEEAFREASEEIMRTIHRAAGDKRIPFTVFKITGIARFELLEKLSSRQQLTPSEQAEFIKVKGRINQICHTAHDLDVRVMVDAEESWIQNISDELFIAMMRRYNREKAIVYNTYQLYRTDKLALLKADASLAETEGFILGVKLVRGAYMEKERERADRMGYISLIHQDKALTDADYNDGLEFCIKNIKNIALLAGTHNEYSCSLLLELVKKYHIMPYDPHVFFAQLLGMGDNLSFNLADAGYNAAKYVPYGPVKAVMPYLFRRAEENTAVAGHAGGELELIIRERKRRKL